MKAFLDTSVLVAAFYGDHVHHEASLRLFAGLHPATGCCGAHSLAGVYSTLTRMPGAHRVSAEQALLFLASVQERLLAVSLTSLEYVDALKRAAQLGVLGGAIYDAILAHCALKAEAELIYTWNVRHYSCFGNEVSKRLQTP